MPDQIEVESVLQRSTQAINEVFLEHSEASQRATGRLLKCDRKRVARAIDKIFDSRDGYHDEHPLNWDLSDAIRLAGHELRKTGHSTIIDAIDALVRSTSEHIPSKAEKVAATTGADLSQLIGKLCQALEDGWLTKEEAADMRPAVTKARDDLEALLIAFDELEGGAA